MRASVFRSAICLVLLVVSCGGGPSTSASGAAVDPLCGDAAGPLLPRVEAGPACLTIGGGACPTIPDAGPPDLATWGCNLDSDCNVFPDHPYCDEGFCSKSQADVTCKANVWRLSGFPSPEVSHTFTGTNGMFADSCDAQGNLVGYQCESMQPPCDPAMNGCDGPLVYTGRVVPLDEVIDCEGTCRSARCDARCPQQGDRVTFKGNDANGGVLVHNDSDGRTYVCPVDPIDQHGENVDCAKVPAGQTGFVSGRSVNDLHCTGAAFGNIAVNLDGVSTPAGLNSCGYVKCSIVQTSSCF